MSEFLKDLCLAVVTAAVPTITVYAIIFIRKLGANAAAKTEDTKAQGYITEITEAVTDAVAATSQTYVDALKASGEFTVAAQKEAARKALAACIAHISPAAQAFIESAYGDLTEYLTTKIEAEVRNQKLTTVGLPVTALESTVPDTTAVAASTAAATAATIAQTAVQQLKSEPTVPEHQEQNE